MSIGSFHTFRGYRSNRRTALICATLAIAAIASAACDPALGAAPSRSTGAAPPSGTPVASWSQDGDFDSPGRRALRPPMLVVFADGTTIADATYQAQLDPNTVSDLLSHLRTSLGTPNVVEPKTPEPTTVENAPVTTFGVWTGVQTLRVQAGGVAESRDDKVYPDALYQAWDQLTQVYQQVTTTAMPYLSDQVRVVTRSTDHATGTVLDWPKDLALPSQASTTLTGAHVTDPTVHQADLTGQDADVAVRLLTRDLDDRGAWPTYRTADNHLIQACWRYLLPSETPAPSQ